jgi:hypothetical protein
MPQAVMRASHSLPVFTLSTGVGMLPCVLCVCCRVDKGQGSGKSPQPQPWISLDPRP